MATLSTIRLPAAKDTKGGWDDNFGDEHIQQFVSKQESSSCMRSSLARHAVAHGCSAIGMSGSRVKWQRAFEYPVCQVASNEDGTVVAASTARGTVSLMRGVDGKVLATRHIASQNDDDATLLSADISFVAGANTCQSIVKDVLIILSPPHHSSTATTTHATHSPLDEFAPLHHHEPSSSQSSIILVSGIDGSSLNSTNNHAVALAARGMSIDGLHLSLTTEHDNDHHQNDMGITTNPTPHITYLTGCFTDSHTIRFLARDSTNRISVHDYNVQTKTSILIQRDIGLSNPIIGEGISLLHSNKSQPSKKSQTQLFQNEMINDNINDNDNEDSTTTATTWTLDEGAGIQIDTTHARTHNTLFLLAASSQQKVKIVWYHLTDLSLLCEYELPTKLTTTTNTSHKIKSRTKRPRPKILALQPIQPSFTPEITSVAVAVSVRTSADANVDVDVSTHVIQAIVEECSDGDVSVSSSPSSPLSASSSSSLPDSKSFQVEEDVDPEMSPGASKRTKRTKRTIVAPHIVYTIPHDVTLEQSHVKSINIVPNDTYISDHSNNKIGIGGGHPNDRPNDKHNKSGNDHGGGAYSLRLKIKYESTTECQEFRAEAGELIGKFRLYLARGMFDEADTILSNSSPNSNHNLDHLSGPYASIHGSEVALWRFRHLLGSGKITSRANMEHAKDCLRRLAAGAVSSGIDGVRCLLRASECLRRWPRDPSFVRDDDRPGPQVRDFRLALTAMSISVANASKGVLPIYVAALLEEKKRLELKAAALKLMELVLEMGKEKQTETVKVKMKQQPVYLTPPFSSVASPSDLFRILVSRGMLNVAERVRLEDAGRNITPNLIAAATLGITSDIDPREYTTWLQDVIIPGLTVNHPLLASIRTWSCRIADELDDIIVDDDHSLVGNDNHNDDDDSRREHRTIDASIHLLQTVQDATAELSIGIHSSFATYSPYIDQDDDEGIPSMVGIRGFRNHQNLDTSGDSAISSLTSSTNDLYGPSSSLSQKQPPNPTIVQVGFLRNRRKPISSRSIIAKRLNQSATLNTSFLDASLISSRRSEDYDSYETRDFGGDDVFCEEENDCVEVKLSQALHLKEARRLGLGRRLATLRSYEEVGGANYLAKELVRLISRQCSNEGDEEKTARLIDEVKPFCESAKVSFDESIAKYTEELCDENVSNVNALEEAASLARACSNPLMKCQVTLKVLRASLLCNAKPSCLTQLSKDAIGWATEESLKSELEEATRLIVIDGIVRRYCGNGAQDFFRVSDSRHGLRLLQHVCRHIDAPSVLTDALALCDAFTHLNRSEACVLILQRMVLAPTTIIMADDAQTTSSVVERRKDEVTKRSEQCGAFLRQVYYSSDGEKKFAEMVGMRVCMFCADTISDCCDSLARNEYSTILLEREKLAAISACSSACSILSVMTELSSQIVVNSGQCPLLINMGSQSPNYLLREYQRILELQKTFNIYISLSELRNQSKHRKITKQLLQPAVNIIIGRNDNGRINDVNLKSALAHAKRGCNLLFGDDPSEVASKWCNAIGSISCQLVKKADEVTCLQMVEASGLLNEMESDTAYKSIVSIAMSLCLRASEEAQFIGRLTEIDARSDANLFSMRCVVCAASLLREHAVVFCPENLLSSMVSLSNMTDVVTQLLVRADCGVGESIDSFRRSLHEQSRSRREPLSKLNLSQFSQNDLVKLPSAPTLHPTWYVGDGLLLPPLEALMHSMDYCKELMFSTEVTVGSSRTNNPSLNKIHAFLESRGAYSMSLRMLACASAVSLPGSRDTVFRERCTIMNDTVRHLAERSLGGSGTGITSGNIDSLLAVTYLFSLPLKTAFKLYKACLPSAISRRDFCRVITLANIGFKTGGTNLLDEETTSKGNIGWKNQEQFVSQCKRLSSKAHWWNILQHYKVSFDPRLFETSSTHDKVNYSKKAAPKSEASTYIASLISELINGASKILPHPNSVLELASDFAKAFCLDPHIAPQKLIEFLLSWQETTDGFENKKIKTKTSCTSDIRYDIAACEVAVRQLLYFLPSKVARSAVLRRCLINLESEEKSGQDFERYAVVLSLYSNELSGVIAEQVKKGTPNTAFNEELERIDRRKDALSILSSFFGVDKLRDRPFFQKCFLPLPNPFRAENKSQLPKFYGVLGAKPGSDPDSFDPLSPLQTNLSSDPSTSTASALAPLCASLGLPSGYVHARALIQRMNKAKSIGVKLPPFEPDIHSVIKRLKSSSDGTDLAEWCANQYKDDSQERLECLEVALDLAMKASNEAEYRRRHNTHKEDGSFEENERRALETLKRISAAKSALSDKIDVQTILEKESNEGCPLSQAHFILENVIKKAQEECPANEYLSPESFVKNLLVKGSQMAAESSLIKCHRFTLDDFRKVSSAIHKACKCLADQYSHIDIGKISRTLVRRWLVHGDEIENSTSKNANINYACTNIKLDFLSSNNVSLNDTISIDEEDTANFVLDINAIATGQEVWTDDVGSNSALPKKVSHVTADEELSALKINSSAREVSEYQSARVGLRVAFVMSFNQDFHFEEKCRFQHQNDENIEGNLQRRSSTDSISNNIDTSPGISKSESSTSKDDASRQGDLAFDHARYLLKIVFAKSGSYVWKADRSAASGIAISERNPLRSVRSNATGKETNNRKRSLEANGQGSNGKVLTFAMRHRALRAASILCPSDVLNIVIEEENYFDKSENGNVCTLSKLCFGSFLAMEIEAMGLPLPHSDLVQLSTMHYPSYGRALLRHHGLGECRGFKGRLMLLLLELALKDKEVSDSSLITLILTEMSSLELPRTLLLGCECVAKANKLDSIVNANNGEGGKLLTYMVKRLSMIVMKELNEMNRNSKQSDTSQTILTLERLAGAIVTFSDRGIGKAETPIFVEFICKFVTSCKNENQNILIDGILGVAVNIACHLSSDKKGEIFAKIADTPGGLDVLKRKFVNRIKESDLKGNDNDDSDRSKYAANESCTILIERMEKSLFTDITTSIFRG